MRFGRRWGRPLRRPGMACRGAAAGAAARGGGAGGGARGCCRGWARPGTAGGGVEGGGGGVVEGGGGGYGIKAFSAAQMDARIRAVLRRLGQDQQGETMVEVGGLRIDPRSREVSVDGSPVELTRKEFDLLLAL